ncbi:hypothetical protein SAMN05444398_103286 [Roseovarius pacificus]|uniref:Uncharacterized protein n=1 Tax=Roseovarius pacificus TaxID=337701 RepID=A0A1M7BLV3_9RHOB|nr:hypothetical protein [Roseovarius pacificus]GGO55251.1 hypothetical protein GCM10011315_17320 [Roseovarius pacificus]SHL55539.1 hypothetical protein SAMN05444398_103286 [Roseovarius pacificus]
MTDFTINSMHIIDAAPSLSGTRVLASYDLTIVGITMKGCIITESPDGIASARGLLGKTNKGDKISAQFTDPTLARAITRKAVEAYNALTGRDVNDE